MSRSSGTGLSHFFASGARAPHLMVPAADPDRTWDDASVRAALLALGGTDAGLLDDPVFAEVMLPYIKADFRMLAAYTRAEPALLDCPVTVLVGEDDPRVTADQAAAWGVTSRAGFSVRTVPGGHFYLADAAPFGVITRSWVPGGASAPGSCASAESRTRRPGAVEPEAYPLPAAGGSVVRPTCLSCRAAASPLPPGVSRRAAGRDPVKLPAAGRATSR
ncbi:thioesterase II family protein [Streptomyces sp. SM10]|uniref:thioesterase II family protein n=1 Tax=Streptomyces sp. SM10 TaxID=565556 RepID=UPI00215611CA|nr:thioesterase domain-containing protein [Streptomyces sp. SM10]